MGERCTVHVWWEYTPLYEKAQKKTKNTPMETTAAYQIGICKSLNKTLTMNGI